MFGVGRFRLLWCPGVFEGLFWLPGRFAVFWGCFGVSTPIPTKLNLVGIDLSVALFRGVGNNRIGICLRAGCFLFFFSTGALWGGMFIFVL